MARKYMCESSAKNLLKTQLGLPLEFITISNPAQLKSSTAAWLKGPLVVKPDEPIGQRRKQGLMCVNVTWDEAQQFILKHLGKEVQANGTKGILHQFLVEPYVQHQAEYYLAFKSERDGDEILLNLQGGIDVDITQTQRYLVPTGVAPETVLPDNMPQHTFFWIKKLFQWYQKNNITFLEINPYCILNDMFIPLGVVAQADDCALQEIKYPPEFGRTVCPEEQIIEQLQSKSQASLKFVVLNPFARIWLLVAGGGASMIYCDTVVQRDYQHLLANYSEYSSNPTTQEMYLYTQQIIAAMTKKHCSPPGKVLVLGGAIANFTNILETFKGILQAIEERAQVLKEHHVEIIVRRAGPSEEQGLKIMQQRIERLGIPVKVYGADAPLTMPIHLAIESVKQWLR